MTKYSKLPPLMLRCPNCIHKTFILPNGRSEMIEHLEEKHNLSSRDAMRAAARIPYMSVVDMDVL